METSNNCRKQSYLKPILVAETYSTRKNVSWGYSHTLESSHPDYESFREELRDKVVFPSEKNSKKIEIADYFRKAKEPETKEKEPEAPPQEQRRRRRRRSVGIEFEAQEEPKNEPELMPITFLQEEVPTVEEKKDFSFGMIPPQKKAKVKKPLNYSPEKTSSKPEEQAPIPWACFS